MAAPQAVRGASSAAPWIASPSMSSGSHFSPAYPTSSSPGCSVSAGTAERRSPSLSVGPQVSRLNLSTGIGARSPQSSRSPLQATQQGVGSLLAPVRSPATCSGSPVSGSPSAQPPVIHTACASPSRQWAGSFVAPSFPPAAFGTQACSQVPSTQRQPSPSRGSGQAGQARPLHFQATTTALRQAEQQVAANRCVQASVRCVSAAPTLTAPCRAQSPPARPRSQQRSLHASSSHETKINSPSLARRFAPAAQREASIGVREAPPTPRTLPQPFWTSLAQTVQPDLVGRTSTRTVSVGPTESNGPPNTTPSVRTPSTSLMTSVRGVQLSQGTPATPAVVAPQVGTQVGTQVGMPIVGLRRPPQRASGSCFVSSSTPSPQVPSLQRSVMVSAAASAASPRENPPVSSLPLSSWVCASIAAPTKTMPRAVLGRASNLGVGSPREQVSSSTPAVDPVMFGRSPQVVDQLSASVLSRPPTDLLLVSQHRATYAGSPKEKWEHAGHVVPTMSKDRIGGILADASIGKVLSDSQFPRESSDSLGHSGGAPKAATFVQKMAVLAPVRTTNPDRIQSLDNVRKLEVSLVSLDKAANDPLNTAPYEVALTAVAPRRSADSGQVSDCGVDGHLVSAKFGTDQVAASRDMATPQESRVSMELTIDDFVHIGASAADTAVDYMPLERTVNVCLTIDDLVSIGKSEPTIELAHREQVNHDRYMVLASGDFPPESRAEALMQSVGGREVAIDNDVTLPAMTHFALEIEARGATVDDLMPVRNSATLTIDDLTHDSALGQSGVHEATIQNVVGVCGEAAATRVGASLTIDDLVYAVPETENDTLLQYVDAEPPTTAFLN